MSLPLHSWDVTPTEAARIQKDLAGKIVLEDCFEKIEQIAGADVAIDDGRKVGIAGVILYRFPDLKEVERVSATLPLRFPYVPGLLAFREAPVLIEALGQLKGRPDLVFFDGQGIAHPRGLGIASHMGLVLDCPTIGCAKSLLVGLYDEPGLKKGDFSSLVYHGKTIGAALRTRDNVQPVFVSPGHKISLESAIRITLSAADRFRVPKPTREADLFVASLKGTRVAPRIDPQGELFL